MLVVCYGFVMQNINIELLNIGSQHNIDKTTIFLCQNFFCGLYSYRLSLSTYLFQTNLPRTLGLVSNDRILFIDYMFVAKMLKTWIFERVFDEFD